VSDARILVGDVGATHARFGLADGSGGIAGVRVYSTAEFSHGATLVDTYLDESSPEELVGACLAVAGPVVDGHAQLSNHPVGFEASDLAARLHSDQVLLVNDFVAVSHAVTRLPASELKRLGGTNGAGVRGVLGPGTGLGVGILIPEGEDYRVLPSEGGHGNLAATNALEMEVLTALSAGSPFLCWETVLSGPGLLNLYRAVCGVWGAAPEADTPEAVSSRGLLADDPVCHQTLEMFCGMLGTAAGNLAVTLCATGGIYLAGGILPQISDFLSESPFRRRFEERGVLSDYLRPIATDLVMDTAAGLKGAAYAFFRRT
jgi:glucokinase